MPQLPPDGPARAELAKPFTESELACLRRDTPAWGRHAHFAHGSASQPPDAVYTAWQAWLDVWAAWIYWHRVPHSAELLERSARFAMFVLTMMVAAAIALYATFWLIVAIFGL